MSGIPTGVLGIASGILTAFNTIAGWFKKSPEQRVQDRIDRKKRGVGDVGKAIKESKSGDTSAIERIINRK